MALKPYNKNQKTYDATVDHQIVIPVPGNFYNVQIFYRNFDGADNSAFKLQRTLVNPASAAPALFDIADSEKVITDSDGAREWYNATPEKANFIIIDYSANTQAGDGTGDAEFDVYVNEN